MRTIALAKIWNRNKVFYGRYSGGSCIKLLTIRFVVKWQLTLKYAFLIGQFSHLTIVNFNYVFIQPAPVVSIEKWISIWQLVPVLPSPFRALRSPGVNLGFDNCIFFYFTTNHVIGAYSHEGDFSKHEKSTQNSEETYRLRHAGPKWMMRSDFTCSAATSSTQQLKPIFKYTNQYLNFLTVAK
jgi:hypothetical protein